MAFPTDNGSTTIHPLPTNRLVQYHVYKVQYQLALARQSGDMARVLAGLVTLAGTYSQFNLLPQAIHTLEQALGIVRLGANRQQEGNLYCTLAEIYRMQGETDTALDYYQRALIIAEAINDLRLKIASLDGLRRTKMAIMMETLRRQSDSLLPPTVTAPTAANTAWRSMAVAMALFVVGFVLAPILLSQMGVSDGVVAVVVIASSVVSLGFLWRYG